MYGVFFRSGNDLLHGNKKWFWGVHAYADDQVMYGKRRKCDMSILVYLFSIFQDTFGRQLNFSPSPQTIRPTLSLFLFSPHSRKVAVTKTNRPTCPPRCIKGPLLAELAAIFLFSTNAARPELKRISGGSRLEFNGPENFPQ